MNLWEFIKYLFLEVLRFYNGLCLTTGQSLTLTGPYLDETLFVIYGSTLKPLYQRSNYNQHKFEQKSNENKFTNSLIQSLYVFKC